MLGLRSRLLLTHGYLVALMFVALGTAVAALTWVGGKLDRIIERDAAVLDATTDMLVALDEEAALLLRSVDGRPAEARTELERSRADFSQAWARAATAVESAESREKLDKLNESYAAHVEWLALDDGAATPDAVRRAWRSVQEVESTAFEVLRSRHKSVLEAQRLARNRGRDAIISIGVLVTIGLVSLVMIFSNFQRVLLDRLAALVEVAGASARGDRHRRADVSMDDELGQVGQSLNEALDREQRTIAATNGRLAEHRALLRGLLAHLDQPTAIVGIDGETIVSTLAWDREQELAQLAPEIRKAAKILLERRFLSPAELFTEIFPEGGERGWSIRSLVAGETRVVGWIAVAAERGVSMGKKHNEA